jgi:hypothetical protein
MNHAIIVLPANKTGALLVQHWQTSAGVCRRCQRIASPGMLCGHPRENFEILYRKRCIFTHCKVCQQYYFAFKIHVDCMTRASQPEKYLVANFSKTFIQNS